MDCGFGMRPHLIEMQRPASPKVEGHAEGIYRRSSLSRTFVAMLRIAFIKSACACVRTGAAGASSISSSGGCLALESLRVKWCQSPNNKSLTEPALVT